MCAQRLSPVREGAGKLAAPTHPAARLELLHARRRAWSILCQHSQARLLTDLLPIDFPNPQPVRAAGLLATSWGWGPRREAQIVRLKLSDEVLS